MKKIKVNDMSCLEEILEMLGLTGYTIEIVEPEPDVNFFLNRIAERKEWKLDRVIDWLNSIIDINPGAALSIILREIALYCNEKYDKRIEECNGVYAISLLDGKIRKVSSKRIKNYNIFAAFMTVEDALFAKRVLKSQFEDMFGCEEREQED